MKKHIFLAGLFMSCLALSLAVLALYFIFTDTKAEVQSVNNQLLAIDKKIDILRTAQTKRPDASESKKELAKLNMEKVLLPQVWLLQMELAEKGLISFIFDVFRSPEARQKSLRRIVLERAKATKIDGCPLEFQRLFKIYASEEGYGSESLQALRSFANSYSGDTLD